MKETRLDVIMHAEMGFSVGSFFAMGETHLVEKGLPVTVLETTRDGERSFVHHRDETYKVMGRNLYAWVNSSYLAG